METRQTGMEGDGGRGTENIARAVGVYDAMRADPSSLVCQRHQRPQHGRYINIRCRKQEGILLQPAFQPCEKLRVVVICPVQLIMISVKGIVHGRQYIIVIIADTLPRPKACRYQIIVTILLCEEYLPE